jgi:PAS domain-containing protein
MCQKSAAPAWRSSASRREIRKLLEAAGHLRERSQRYVLLPDGIILRVNRRLCQSLGLEPPDLGGPFGGAAVVSG